tara:strand:- start:9173 stop:9925 length:753 start_codon:yes stop_codon:yes gene_type:complete
MSPDVDPFPAPEEKLIPDEGWHFLHLFYQIDHAHWAEISDQDRLEAKTNLTELAQEIRTHPNTQFLTFSIVSPKADIGFILVTPDLHDLNMFEKRISQSLGPDMLNPVYSYLSMTEISEYTTSKQSVGVKDSLYPRLPDWPILAFYNIMNRREPGQNWYELSFDQRRKLIQDCEPIEESYEGRVQQLVTTSVGLDDAERAVSLFAQDTCQIKDIVYQMRSNPINAVYSDFGEFYLGIQLPLNKLFRRVGI